MRDLLTGFASGIVTGFIATLLFAGAFLGTTLVIEALS